MTKPIKYTERVSACYLAAIVKQAIRTDNKLISVTNVKKDGTTRHWVINPKAGRKAIKGDKIPDHLPHNMIRVFDQSAACERNAKGQFTASGHNGWRILNTDTISRARINGVEYVAAVEPLPASPGNKWPVCYI